MGPLASPTLMSTRAHPASVKISISIYCRAPAAHPVYIRDTINERQSPRRVSGPDSFARLFLLPLIAEAGLIQQYEEAFSGTRVKITVPSIESIYLRNESRCISIGMPKLSRLFVCERRFFDFVVLGIVFSTLLLRRSTYDGVMCRSSASRRRAIARLLRSARSKSFTNVFYLRRVRSIPSCSFYETSCFREPIWMVSPLIDAFQIIAYAGNRRLMKIFDFFFSYKLTPLARICGSSREMNIMLHHFCH